MGIIKNKTNHMYTTENILDLVKRDVIARKQAYLSNYDAKIVEVNFGQDYFIFMHDDGHTLEFCFEKSYYIASDSPKEKNNGLGRQYTIGFKTPKGYISKKSTGVIIADRNDITLAEAAELMAFNTDAVKNTFDPFYAENQAKHRSAAAMADLARGYNPRSL